MEGLLDASFNRDIKAYIPNGHASSLNESIFVCHDMITLSCVFIFS